MAHHLAFSLAALTTFGGAIGFAKTKSVPSLAGGGLLGAMFLTSGYLMQNNKDYGLEMAAGTSGFMTAIMLPRAIKGKPLPIVLSVVGLVSGIYYGRKLMEYY